MVTYHESMYSYCADADISHYQLSTVIDAYSKNVLVVAFSPPYDDTDLYISRDTEDMIMYHGDAYTYINWGETDINFIKIDSIDELCYILYIYDYDSHRYVSDGNIYETEDAANDAAREYLEV